MTGEREYYILSLKWSGAPAALNGAIGIWWCPDNKGYTYFLDRAGRYAEGRVAADRSYYDDGINALAIPCEEVDPVAMRAVPDWEVAKLIMSRGIATARGSEEATP